MKALRIAITAIMFLTAGAGVSAGPNLSELTVSLDLEDAPIRTVLQMIALQNGINIVVAGDVDGDVSTTLDNVALATALEVILAPNGLSYYTHNDVIVVKPLDGLSLGELQSQVLTLKYLDPHILLNALATRMSPRGDIVVLDKASSEQRFSPNRVIITDIPSVIGKLVAIANTLDVPERLISIDVKIIETKVDNKDKIGFVWPSSITTTLGAGSQTSATTSTTTGTAEANTSTLENVAGSHDLNAGKWTWGTLTVAQMRTVLDLLNQRGNSKLVSDPHITTVENHEAEIKVTTVIPIPTVNRFTEGSSTSDILTFQDEEVGLTLKVTPRINDDGGITLDVHPSVEDIIGYAGPTDNQKPITAERSIQTRVTVKDGETVVLGGLMKEDKITTVQKVPLLGSIPVLGPLLFTNKSDETATTDLTILITPHVLP